MFQPIPSNTNLKTIKITKTRLENGWGIIPNTFGKLFYSEDLDIGACLTIVLYFEKSWN